MVKVSLLISAQLENIEHILISKDYSFFLKLQCSNCREVSVNWHELVEEIKFKIKCRLCNRENSIDIVPGSNGQYSSNDSGKMKSIITFDCRGVEPTEFDPRAGLIIKASDGGQTFEDVDLTLDNGDWCEYDVKNKETCSISEFKSEFKKVKK